VKVWSSRTDNTPRTITVLDTLIPEYLSGESPAEFQWNYSGKIATVSIDLSLNNGTTWIPIEKSVKNEGIYFWKSVYNFSSDSCRVRITNDEDPRCFSISKRFRISFDPERNLIKNGDFSMRANDWNLAIADTTTTNSFRVDTANGGYGLLQCGSIPQESWMFNVNQFGIPLKKGSAYVLSFRAKCSKPDQQLYVLLQEGRAPWGDYGTRLKRLDTVWTTYSDTLFMARDDDPSAFLAFVPREVEKATISIDDVVLKRFF